MKEYKQPVIKTLELKADLEFAMVTSNPRSNLGNIFDKNSIYEQGLDD